ncbi:MAG: DUF305 domain-containing protein [Propionibacteriaceae bacterium]|nr:DUF305 domain-containing protein [Propionibacteriaceae bacterium]
MERDAQGQPASGHAGDERQGSDHSSRSSYLKFAGMIGSSAVAMYVVMYFNTYSIDHVYFSWTRLFMTMMSTAVMAVIMLAFMRHMYRSRAFFAGVVLASVVLFAAGLGLVRSQATVDDVAWMEGMIPHHSIAILTSENAQITDPRVRVLADSIIEAQVKEIDEMKALVEELRR